MDGGSIPGLIDRQINIDHGRIITSLQQHASLYFCLCFLFCYIFVEVKPGLVAMVHTSALKSRRLAHSHGFPLKGSCQSIGQFYPSATRDAFLSVFLSGYIYEVLAIHPFKTLSCYQWFVLEKCSSVPARRSFQKYIVLHCIHLYTMM